jgi:serine phosphatase RsbU (regulator of sigma subunit)
VGYFASPLGAWESGGWQPETVTLEPGDQLVLYTDGVIDTVGHGERFGEQRLADVLAGAEGASDAIHAVDQALRDFAQGPQGDDTAVLALERVAAVARGEDEDDLRFEGAPA